MATRNSTATSSTRRSPARRSSVAKDAVQLLRADHAEVKAMFDSFKKTRGAERKAALAQRICAALTVHAQIEEEIFYPAAREVLRQQDLLDEAEVEHASAKDLIAQIESMSAEEELFDAKVTVLGEYVMHHVKEEQNELFPKLRKTSLDLEELGAQLAARKQQLMGSN